MRQKSIEYIPVKNLSTIWKESQRPLNKTAAGAIAANFDDDMLGVLAVTLPNGHGIYHVIDGQHRRAAVEEKFGQDMKVPCEVFDAVDPARAAVLFDAINSNRKSVRPIDTFKIRRTGEYETEVEIDKIIRAAGYRIDSARIPKVIGCVEALRYVYTRCGAQTLQDTLKLIQASWGVNDPNAVHASIVKGYGIFLLQHGAANWGRVKQVMIKKYTPGSLIVAARVRVQNEGGQLHEAIKYLLVTRYNHGTPKLPKPKQLDANI
jgi:hypothetical protein